VARLRLVRRSSLGAGASISTRPGLTVADWSNLAHWASACVLVAAEARSELPGLGRFGAALAARASEAVWVALPQVASNRTACGGASGLPALVSRGAPSEMFALLALASTRVAVEALGNGSAPSRAAAAAVGGKSLLLCRDIAPVPRAYICFDALIRARWSDAALGGRHAMIDALEAVSGRAGAAASAATGEALRSQARALLGLPAAAPEAGGRRVIVLLTRRTQSAWVNRPSVARAVSLAARAAGVRFEDAGDAEDLGRGPGGCYGAAAQVRLWSRAWLVVSVAGAHEANAVWLACGSAGLLESLNCGHATGTYRALAAATGGRYAAASEVRQQGHRWLRSASRPLLDQACVHLGLRRGCRAEEVLAARPRLYERKNCTAQRRSDALYFNLPRVHDLEGGETADLLAALHRLLGLSPPWARPHLGPHARRREQRRRAGYETGRKGEERRGRGGLRRMKHSRHAQPCPHTASRLPARVTPGEPSWTAGDKPTLCGNGTLQVPQPQLFAHGGLRADWASTEASPHKLSCRILSGERFNTPRARAILIVSHGDFIRECAKLLRVSDGEVKRQLETTASNNLFSLSVKSRGVVYVLLRHCHKEGQMTGASATPRNPPCVRAQDGRICGLATAVAQLTRLLREWGVAPAGRVGLYSSCMLRAKSTAAAIREAVPHWWTNGSVVHLLPFVSEAHDWHATCALRA